MPMPIKEYTFHKPRILNQSSWHTELLLRLCGTGVQTDMMTKLDKMLDNRDIALEVLTAYGSESCPSQRIRTHRAHR